MKTQGLWTVACRVLLFCAATAIASPAQECRAVAYLFRHVEDVNKDKQKPFDVTLSTSGQAHAQLYIEMVNKLQQEKPGYCPVKVVYALNPEKFDGSIGTSNPYWTANPLAQTAQTNTDDSTMEDTNPVITIEVMNKELKLTEYLNHGEGDQFIEDIKAILNNQQSVAIFWTSDGMCAVARKLGPSIPYSCVAGSKPARNSVFRFNYDVLQGKFTDVTSKYFQCFNYNANTDSFSNTDYYCQFSANLLDWEGRPGFSANLQEISGRICDKDKLEPPCIP